MDNSRQSFFFKALQINWLEMPLFCLLLAGWDGGYSEHGGVYDLEVRRRGRRELNMIC